MAKTTTLRLTRAELELLRKPAWQQWNYWTSKATLQNFRDEKEKDRVLTYQYMTGQLLDKVLVAMQKVSK